MFHSERLAAVKRIFPPAIINQLAFSMDDDDPTQQIRAEFGCKPCHDAA